MFVEPTKTKICSYVYLNIWRLCNKIHISVVNKVYNRGGEKVVQERTLIGCLQPLKNVADCTKSSTYNFLTRILLIKKLLSAPIALKIRKTN